MNIDKVGKRVITSLFITILILGFFLGKTPFISVDANNAPTPTPERLAKITQEVTQYDWWLVYWSDNSVACSLSIFLDGKPTKTDILSQCGQKIYQLWIKPQTCNSDKNGVILSSCSGMYLHPIGSQIVNAERQVYFSPPEILVQVEGCVFEGESTLCIGDTPVLRFSGVESMPDQKIVGIYGEIDGDDFTCQGDTCSVSLDVTDEDGIPFSFWGDSSFGDQTAKYQGLLRVIQLDDQVDAANTYLVDVYSSQWKGNIASTCGAVWNSFEPVNNPSVWAAMIDSSTDLYSNNDYYYLSAMLLQNGLVDGQSCPNNGFENQSYANECGSDITRDAVVNWQNQFNDQILFSADQNKIPAKLLKNIIARESQFWPVKLPEHEETGFGHLTLKGADTALMWNPLLYSEICKETYHDKTCSIGYSNIKQNQKGLLQEVLLSKLDAKCADCQAGIDIEKANYSIDYFSQTLIGNCSQVEQIYQNLFKKDAGQLTAYNDLWRFTIVNYNSGAGCLYNAIEKTKKQNMPIDWIHVGGNLEKGCQGVVDYVFNVTNGETVLIDSFSTPSISNTQQTITLTLSPTNSTITLTTTPQLLESATPTFTSTLTPTPSPTPTSTLTPTPTGASTDTP